MKMMKTRFVYLLTCVFYICGEPIEATRNVSVIIVGAGSAGIAAATRLLENGVNNLVIVEAENRIGGRIYSVKFGDAYVDVGAENCHGEKGNIVYQMTKKHRILKHSSGDLQMVYSTGEVVEKPLAKELYNYAFNYSDFAQDDSDYYSSIGEFILKNYKENVLKKYENDEKKLRISEDAISTVECALLEEEGAFDWFRPALNSNYEECPGDQDIHWNGLGYKTILDIMMKKFPNKEDSLPIDDKILLNKRVTKVIWNKLDGKTEVRTSDGSTFVADHVVFTASLGVLKHDSKKIFVPSLSKEKKDCIFSLGFDAVMKVHLHFPVKWWKEVFINHLFVWSREDKQNLTEQYPYGPKKDGQSWLLGVYRMYQDPNNPNVLLAWVIGESVPNVEKASSQTVMDGIMFLVRKFLGNKYNITQPDKVLYSTWYSNSNFRGSYSYETPDILKKGDNCQQILADPLYNREGRPVLLFGGEATSSKHYSTVHGAIESGYRVADIILEYKEFN